MIMFSSQGVQLIFHTQGPISCTGRVGRLQEILQNTSFCVVNSAPLFKKLRNHVAFQKLVIKNSKLCQIVLFPI